MTDLDWKIGSGRGPGAAPGWRLGPRESLVVAGVVVAVSLGLLALSGIGIPLLGAGHATPQPTGVDRLNPSPAANGSTAGPNGTRATSGAQQLVGSSTARKPGAHGTQPRITQDRTVPHVSPRSGPSTPGHGPSPAPGGSDGPRSGSGAVDATGGPAIPGAGAGNHARPPVSVTVDPGNGTAQANVTVGSTASAGVSVDGSNPGASVSADVNDPVGATASAGASTAGADASANVGGAAAGGSVSTSGNGVGAGVDAGGAGAGVSVDNSGVSAGTGSSGGGGSTISLPLH